MDTPQDTKNAAAIAWVEQWYATPDEQPSGYWEMFEQLLQDNPITFADEDLNV